jgi:hypothetical protein
MTTTAVDYSKIFPGASQQFYDALNAIQSGGAKVGSVTIPSQDENGNDTSFQSTALVDSSGNPISSAGLKQVGTNQYVISTPSTGGTMNIPVSIDPKTGTIQPINNYQSVSYTGGSSGSVLGQIGNTVNGALNDPLVNAAISLAMPGAAPFLAGAKTVQSVASGKPLNTGTVLNALTSASGLGSTLGLDPSTVDALNTAKNAVSGVNAVQTGNLAGALTSLNNLTNILPAGSSQLGNVVSGIAALKKGDTAGALSALSSLTSDPNLQIASQAAGVLKQLSPILGGVAATPSSSSSGASSGASSSASPSAAAAPMTSGIATPQTTQTVAGPIVAYDMEGVYNPFVTNEIQTAKMSAKGGAIGLPSLLRGK